MKAFKITIAPKVELFTRAEDMPTLLESLIMNEPIPLFASAAAMDDVNFKESNSSVVINHWLYIQQLEP